MYSALDIVNLSPVIPVIRIEPGHDPVALGRALLAGGVNVMEITLRTDAAWQAIERLRTQLPEMVGVGTVTQAAEVDRARDAGAQFLVSPGCTPELIAAAHASATAFLPGVMTPSEILRARDSGCSVLKLFPAQPAGGIDMLKALKGPFPDVTFCPTGGIDAEAMPSFLALDNVGCVGGSWLTPNDAVNDSDWRVIEDLARQAIVTAGRRCG